MENNGKDEGLSSQPFLCVFSLFLIFGSLWARTSFSGRQSEEAAVSVASDAAEAISVSAASEKSEGSFTAEPVVSAETAVLIDAASGKVLYDKRKDAHMYPASTTKIATALIALETMDPEEYTTVSENAVRQEGSSIYLKPDEKIRMKDLLYGMMLRSGNDAAVAVAEAAGGSGGIRCDDERESVSSRTAEFSFCQSFRTSG